MRCIATDLDGTLLNKKGEVSQKTIAVLKRLLDEGVLLILCTGRSYESAERLIKSIGLEGQNAYFCGMNGQNILSFKDQKSYEKGTLENKEIQRLASYIQNKNVLAILQDKKEMNIVYDLRRKWLIHAFMVINRLLWIYRQNDAYSFPQKRALNDLPSNDFAKICFTGLHPDLMKIKEEIHKESDIYKCLFLSSSWMECQLKEVNKGAAIQMIAEMEGIPLEEIVAFGDGENDISMLEVAGRGIAMKNAMKNVKDIADDVCGNHDQDGVANYILEKLLA